MHIKIIFYVRLELFLLTNNLYIMSFSNVFSSLICSDVKVLLF